MKSLIITVAGTATRFNRDTIRPTLKCLYAKGGYKNTLLYQILDKSRDVDEYIIVGGYLFDRLKAFIDENLNEFSDKIKLVYNDKYSEYGSGYSLILGIKNVDNRADEIIFVEGDLYFDNSSYESVKKSSCNVFTVNHELITSRKAVALYINEREELHYLYDTSHVSLFIPEPFLAVYNSGQVWKFQDLRKLNQIIDTLSEEQVRGTNLEIVQRYFVDLSSEDRQMIVFSTWYNCNTVMDYEEVYKAIRK